jgi:hypothetical protein
MNQLTGAALSELCAQGAEQNRFNCFCGLYTNAPFSRLHNLEHFAEIRSGNPKPEYAERNAISFVRI